MKNTAGCKDVILQAGLRALVCNLVLGGILWIAVQAAVSAHHLTAVLNYQLLLHLLILLMVGIYGITLVVFVLGILIGLLAWKRRQTKSAEVCVSEEGRHDKT